MNVDYSPQKKKMLKYSKEEKVNLSCGDKWSFQENSSAIKNNEK